MLCYQVSATSVGSQELDNSDWTADKHGAVLDCCLCSSAQEKPKPRDRDIPIKTSWAVHAAISSWVAWYNLRRIFAWMFWCFHSRFLLVWSPHILPRCFKVAKLSEIHRNYSESSQIQWAGPCISHKFITMECEGQWQGRLFSHHLCIFNLYLPVLRLYGCCVLRITELKV